MKISSILENQIIEKRTAITPEIAKKYISLGFEVALFENYGSHLGIKDKEYKELGVSILKNEKEIISNADIIVQLGLLNDDKNSLLKENQTFIGVLNPYDNKNKITYLKSRPGERYASALTKMSNNRKIINKYGKIDLKDYVTSFIKGKNLWK